MGTFKKESNWLPFIQIKPDIDNIQVASSTKLKEANNIDHLLKMHSNIFFVTSYDKLLFLLREHAKNVENLSKVEHASVGEYRSGKDTPSVWTNIIPGSKQ